ncbi:SAV_2336 N-terminal domain-related protein [Roseibium sp. MMSF_3412]|uniref:SAV_2336 N-terminal domain-related protein n=1 Tax=Roseibium sp. MMSF_3412 TaxID=3046712 RepID=UPI00273E3479|nr:SAV_2336 N-terminal domain-related protein [Roseibium sp. MMSF_3412]
MTLKAFISALADDEGPPALGEILDALWLAGLGVPLTLDFDIERAPQPLTPEASDEQETASARTSADAPISSQEKSRLANGGTQETSPEERAGDALDVFERGQFAPGADGRRASPIIAPAAHTISEPLRIARAVKPLQRQRFSSRRMELDEERTTELTAQIRLSFGQGVFLALRPQRERWYDLHLILEDDPYAEIWAPMLRDFRRIMSDTGAFRSVRQWRLRLGPHDCKGTRSNVPGSALDGPASQDRTIVDATLESTSGQRLPLRGLAANRETLILFASHGESHHWLTGVYHDCLKTWASASLALLHLMPPARWSRMVLDTPQGIARSHQPGDPASALEFEWYLRPEEDAAELASDPPFILPVTSVDPQILGAWTSMQMGLGHGHEAYAFRNADRVPVSELEQPRSVVQVEATAARRRRAEATDVALSNLRRRSHDAFELAMYLAHAPFTLPVARLVQEVMMKPDGAALATLVMSDLVRIKDGVISDKMEMTYFELTEAIRDDLLSRLRRSDIETLCVSLQNHLSAKLRSLCDREISFDVLVEDAAGLEVLPNWAQPFARFGTEVQRVVRKESKAKPATGGEVLTTEVGSEQKIIPRGLSLHCGLNTIDPENYGGWGGALAGCENDAIAMRQLASSQGFETTLLLTQEAIKDVVVSSVRHAASVLSAGDIFLWSFSGHAQSRRDTKSSSSSATPDGLALYDSWLTIDELYELCSEFESGVRILIVADSHAGALVRPSELSEKGCSAMVLLLSACGEDQFAQDGPEYGVFTGALLKVWGNEQFTGGYSGFRDAIDAEMDAPRQTPSLIFFGANINDFLDQTPFTILADIDNSSLDANVETSLPKYNDKDKVESEEEQDVNQHSNSALARLDKKSFGALLRLCSTNIDLSPEDIEDNLWHQINEPEILKITEDRRIWFEHSNIQRFSMEFVGKPYLGLTILWVDDNPGNNTEFEITLAKGGANIRTERSTEAALADSEFLQRCDLVLSDMSREGDDTAGYELIAALRNKRPSLPVIIFAGYTLSTPYRRREVVTFGAFGATNRSVELMELVDRAALATTLKKGSPARIAIEDEILQKLPKVSRDIEEIPEGEFCTLEEIYDFLSDEEELLPSEKIIGNLVFFQTERQRSWLIATTRRLLFLLDDPDTRDGRFLVQRRSPVAESFAVKASENAKGSPVVRIGNNNLEPAWFYSASLFEKPSDIETAIRSLVQNAMTAVERTNGTVASGKSKSASKNESKSNTEDTHRDEEEVEFGDTSRNDTDGFSEAFGNERIVGDTEDRSYLPITQVKEIAKLANSVGRIRVGSSGTIHTGTGFLIGDGLFITSAHVVPSLEVAMAAEVDFAFQAGLDESPVPVVRFKPVPNRLFITNRDLDYSIFSLNYVSIDSSRNISEFGSLESKLTEHEELTTGTKVNLIHQPADSPMVASIEFGSILNIEDFVFHYDHATVLGSSGAPVFNEGLKVIGFHHAAVSGPDGRMVGEAVRWVRIAEDIKKRISGLESNNIQKLRSLIPE